jgi:hypothetical protein
MLDGSGVKAMPGSKIQVAKWGKTKYISKSCKKHALCIIPVVILIVLIVENLVGWISRAFLEWTCNLFSYITL